MLPLNFSLHKNKNKVLPPLWERRSAGWISCYCGLKTLLCSKRCPCSETNINKYVVLLRYWVWMSCCSAVDLNLQIKQPQFKHNLSSFFFYHVICHIFIIQRNGNNIDAIVPKHSHGNNYSMCGSMWYNYSMCLCSKLLSHLLVFKMMHFNHETEPLKLTKYI